MSTLTFLSGMLRENKLSLKPFSASSPIYVSALKKVMLHATLPLKLSNIQRHTQYHSKDERKKVF